MKAFSKRKLITVLLAVVYLLSIKGFSRNLDSLENVLVSKDLITEEYLAYCDDLSWSYLDHDFERSKKYALLGIERAKTDQNMLMEARLYRNLGVAYYMNSQMDTAQLYLNISLEKAVLLKDEQLEAAVYGAIGNVHNVSGNYREALSCYLKALPVFERYDNKERIRSLLGNIATLYYSITNLDLAERYF